MLYLICCFQYGFTIRHPATLVAHNNRHSTTSAESLDIEGGSVLPDMRKGTRAADGLETVWSLENDKDFGKPNMSENSDQNLSRCSRLANVQQERRSGSRPRRRKHRVPAHTDRILYHSLSGGAGALKETHYELCDALLGSDHRPVSCGFNLEVVFDLTLCCILCVI